MTEADQPLHVHESSGLPLARPGDQPRELRAGLHLLDHQILDPDARMAGKVDDLELEPADDGGPPTVVAILSGAGALARQFQGRFGRWLESVDERLTHEESPSRIPFSYVEAIGSHVTVTVHHEELQTARAERWARDTVIDHIPGAGHAPH
ncbi:MAG: hypothetical protein JWL73_1243 [Actinomycetia bacterium]|nr:hypothetical protein [Actinomycetes bacterium]